MPPSGVGQASSSNPVACRVPLRSRRRAIRSRTKPRKCSALRPSSFPNACSRHASASRCGPLHRSSVKATSSANTRSPANSITSDSRIHACRTDNPGNDRTCRSYGTVTWIIEPAATVQPWMAAAVAPERTASGPALSSAAADRVTGSRCRGAGTTTPDHGSTQSPASSIAASSATPNSRTAAERESAPCCGTTGRPQDGAGRATSVTSAGKPARFAVMPVREPNAPP